MVPGISAALADVASTSASAGGFAVREQSATHQGASFAGSASGNDLSSMFWNPAAVTNKSGMNSESHGALILGDSEITARTGSTLLGFGAESGNIAVPALVTSSYASYQINEKTFIGFSMNAPFGLTTKPDNDPYAGTFFGRTSKVLTVNLAPTIGYKVMPGVSVAAGVQIEYITAKLSRRPNPAAPGVVGTIDGDDIGFGFTAGVMLEPTSTTKIGLGFRSMVAHDLAGDFTVNLNEAAKANVSASVDMPEIVTLSLRQGLTPSLTLLGTVEWTNWSRVKQLDVVCRQSAGACLGVGGAGNVLTVEELNYEDGWFFAAGLEYQYSPQMVLRTGLAYEISPIRNNQDRGIRVPDNDRIWASIGMSYDIFANTTLDVSYTHIFVEDGGIDRTDPGKGVRFVGDVEQSVNIISAAVKMKIGG